MKKFSLIIPVYHQEKTIRRDIERILAVLSKTPYDFEIIPVIDGYSDESKTQAMKVQDKRIRVVGYETNHGKGYAVRYGFANATGDVIGFMDAGGDLSPESLPLMIQEFLYKDADVVIGSKRHPESKVYYPFIRKMTSFFYQILVRLLFGLSVRDTQVGMKIYKRTLLETVLPRLLVKQFAFDIEVLAVSNHLGYSKIIEAPVSINMAGVFSSITAKRLIAISFLMLRDTLAVYYRLNILHYYDEESKRKWRYDPELNFRVNID